METAISIKGLEKRYGRIEALKSISLDVGRGEIFGLLGANGAGKSTLIKILVGMIKAKADQLQVLGFNPLSQAHALRHQVGYMPQAPALYEDLSARDNIRFFARAHQIANLEARLDNVLTFANLRDRENDAVYGFSGGMKQRVSLACALAHKPNLLLLDEPTAGIDPKLREAFWKHFRELAAQGVTILVSTHQMDEALHCDRVAVMREGIILASDTPRGLLSRGEARVKIWRDTQVSSEVIQHYAEQLPRLLHLDADITRIEIEEDTLEDIVLKMINSREVAHA